MASGDNWSPYEHVKQYPVDTNSKEYIEKAKELAIRQATRNESSRRLNQGKSAEVPQEQQEAIRKEIELRFGLRQGFIEEFGRAENIYKERFGEGENANKPKTDQERIQEAFNKLPAEEQKKILESQELARRSTLAQIEPYLKEQERRTALVYDVGLVGNEKEAISRSLFSAGTQWSVQTLNAVAMALGTSTQTQGFAYRGTATKTGEKTTMVSGRTTQTGIPDILSSTVSTQRQITTRGGYDIYKTVSVSQAEALTKSGYELTGTTGTLIKMGDTFFLKGTGEPLIVGTATAGRTSALVSGDRSIGTIDIVGSTQRIDISPTPYGYSNLRTVTTPSIVGNQIIPASTSPLIVTPHSITSPTRIKTGNIVLASSGTLVSSDTKVRQGTASLSATKERQAQVLDLLSTTKGLIKIGQVQTPAVKQKAQPLISIVPPVTKEKIKGSTKEPSLVSPPTSITPERPTLPPFFVPVGFSFGGGRRSQRTKKQEPKKTRGFGYNPSLSSAILGITSTKKPTKKVYSGFEIRPIIVSKKKKNMRW